MRTELQQQELNFTNAFSGSLEDNDFKFCFMMIIVDTIIYAVIGAMCEKFLRGKYRHQLNTNLNFCNNPFFYTIDDNNFYEVTRTNINKDHGAELKNVTKIYDGDKSNKKAVDDISLVLKRDQVTALLGRNGAGKSTIM